MNRYDAHAPPVDPRATAAARERLQLPAVFLLVVGVLNLAAALVPVGLGLATQVIPPDQMEQELERRQPGPWAALQEKGITIETLLAGYLYGGLGIGAAIGLVGLLTMVGAARMLVLRSYGLAVFAAIVAAIPCVSPSGCCLLGEIVGLWALIVLIDPDVRGAFT